VTARPQESVSFDKAAGYYDRTRTIPAAIANAQRDAILAELGNVGADRLLEIGIGTGLVSRPLMERGVHVTGVDISPKMLGRLRQQLTDAHAPPHLLLGDATRLPFAAGAFPAIVMSHVFHVVADVERTLDEITRVLAPGGVFLHDRTRYSESNPWHASYAAREELMASLGVVVRHRPTPTEIERGLQARGGSLRVARYAERTVENVAEGMLAQARSNLFSWSWGVAEDTFQAFLGKYDQWCREHYTQDEYVIAHEMEVWTFA
jgi:ubiquinone/menaquinone biosynthesis C-methylase UbiE